MIVMTEPLVNFFKKRIRKSVPILHYPLTLDCKRFINADSSNEFNFKYIGYIGYMGGNKDGVLDLLKSFIIVNKSFKNIKLLLVGNANKLDIDVIKDFVIKNNLSEFVVFTGQVDRNKIPDILKSAEVLVLARPQSLQSLGGFPTKLGEYLSSGNPVVVTKVGDIPKFIIDKEHALLCVPGDIDDIAEKIINILSNPQFYRQMAIKGQKFAEEKFDYIKQAYTLEAFLSENFHE
jgi:glycosyltransferase involved in cell wall biosynthesis